MKIERETYISGRVFAIGLPDDVARDVLEIVANHLSDAGFKDEDVKQIEGIRRFQISVSVEDLTERDAQNREW